MNSIALENPLKNNIFYIIASAAILISMSCLPIAIVFPVLIVAAGLIFGFFMNKSFLSSLFISAFLLRIIFSIFLFNLVFLYNGWGLFGDGYSYNMNAGVILDLWFSGVRDMNILAKEAFRLSASGNLGSYDFWNAIVYYFTGPSPLTMIFINCLVSSLTAVLVYFIAKEMWNERSARFAAGLTAFWPSTFFWSVQNLKEPLVIFLCMTLVWIFIKLKKQFRFYTIFIILASTIALKYLRGFMVPLFYGIILPGSVFLSLRHKKAILFWTVVFSVAIIIVIRLYHPSLIDPYKVLKFLQQERTGRSYGNLGLMSNFNAENISCLIVFMPIFFINALLAPYPWQVGSVSQITSAPEMLLFYFFIPVMLAGSGILLKNRAKGAWTLIMYILAITAILAVIEGNAGTLFRHRSMILPACFILIGVGLDKYNFRVSFHK